jgi:hypothetical protein
LIVTPAPLMVTASNATKSFGDTAILTAFTSTGLANGETIGSTTLTSPGAIASAAVVGSPYAITASDPTGGTFTPSNYTIAFSSGVLAVTPLVPVSVVVPPGSTPPGSTPPDATPPDLPIGTIPTTTSPGTTDPSTTSPSTTSPDTTTTSSSQDAVGSSAGVAGLALTVVGGGVRMPPVQLAQTAPVRTPPVALAPADAAAVEPGPVMQSAPVQTLPAVGQTAAPPAGSLLLRRKPKHDRN